MKAVGSALVLGALLVLSTPAPADEPGVALDRYPRARRIVVEHTIAPAYGLVPACWNTLYTTLLVCMPRVYVYPNAPIILNELDALPSRVRQPYPYLFSW